VVMALFFVVLLSAAIWVALLSLRGPGLPREVRLATGQKGGTILPLGETLATVFSQALGRVRFKALESPGGLASIAMLESGEADLALLPNHVRGGESVRLIAPLYEETLQVVVRTAAGIKSPYDLLGKRVSVGPEGSGSSVVATAILHHFGIPAEGLQLRNMAHGDAVTEMEAGNLDAIFVVAGMRTPAVDTLLRRDDMTLLSLGEPGQVGSALEGIRLDAPFFTVTVIPKHSYGRQPAAPVGTISVQALLVARADLDETLVHEITESLFAHKLELSTQESLLSHLSERFDPGVSPYPLHAGADSYYRRDEPTIVQRYMNEISFAITIGALLWSGISAFTAARRQARRSRIETHYANARQLALVAQTAGTPAALAEARAQLVLARERALDELASELLDANEGYMILQDYLSARIAEIDRQRG
jgi:TRAP transporter TAXI family solute receptor